MHAQNPLHDNNAAPLEFPNFNSKPHEPWPGSRSTVLVMPINGRLKSVSWFNYYVLLSHYQKATDQFESRCAALSQVAHRGCAAAGTSLYRGKCT